MEKEVSALTSDGNTVVTGGESVSTWRQPISVSLQEEQTHLAVLTLLLATTIHRQPSMTDLVKAPVVLDVLTLLRATIDSSATIDDGSCESTSCAGCTDSASCNYDSSATIDDGSCENTIVLDV